MSSSCYNYCSYHLSSCLCPPPSSNLSVAGMLSQLSESERSCSLGKYLRHGTVDASEQLLLPHFDRCLRHESSSHHDSVGCESLLNSRCHGNVSLHGEANVYHSSTNQHSVNACPVECYLQNLITRSVMRFLRWQRKNGRDIDLTMTSLIMLLMTMMLVLPALTVSASDVSCNSFVSCVNVSACNYTLCPADQTNDMCDAGASCPVGYNLFCVINNNETSNCSVMCPDGFNVVINCSTEFTCDSATHNASCAIKDSFTVSDGLSTLSNMTSSSTAVSSGVTETLTSNVHDTTVMETSVVNTATWQSTSVTIERMTTSSPNVTSLTSSPESSSYASPVVLTLSSAVSETTGVTRDLLTTVVTSVAVSNEVLSSLTATAGSSSEAVTESATTVAATGNTVPVGLIVGVIVGVFVAIVFIAVVAFFVKFAQNRRALHGTYHPSKQEMASSRTEFGNVLKPPPEERLI